MGITLFISSILKICLNGIIVALAALEFWQFVSSWRKLRELKKRIDSLIGAQKISKRIKEKEPKKVVSEIVSKTELNFDDFDDFCGQYQRDAIVFSRFSLVIQLFPLLGILGTVAGLYYAMNSNQDWTNAQGLFEGVRLALSSTIYGILFAVLFKVLDVFLDAYYINYIEDGIERFRDKYNEEKGIPLGESHDEQKRKAQE